MKRDRKFSKFMGEKIKQFREAQDPPISQAYLGRRIGIKNDAQQTISKYETGKLYIPIPVWLAIADVFNVSPFEFLPVEEMHGSPLPSTKETIKMELAATDPRMPRVLDELIDVMIKKEIIKPQDLPKKSEELVSRRQILRKRL